MMQPTVDGDGIVFQNREDMSPHGGQLVPDEKKEMAGRLLNMLHEEWIFELCSTMMDKGLIKHHDVKPEISESVAKSLNLSKFFPGHLTLQQTRPLTQDCPSRFGDPSEGSISTKGQTTTFSLEAKEFSTVAVHNLPRGTVQSKAMAWVDCAGFKNTYDFFLWFPAKRSAQSGYGYLFINFLSTAHAKYFQILYHGYKFPDDDTQRKKHGLRIKAANLQGFGANYERYRHMMDPSEKSNCMPFFAQCSVEKFLAAELRFATNKLEACTLATTVTILNLPPCAASQDLAMVWLDEAGYRDEYDFCFRTPSIKTPGETTYKTAHMVVNFEKHETAKRCVQTLNWEGNLHGEPLLEVIYSRIQGTDACMRHFQACFGGTKATFRPWVKT